jgi:hypothetical protein
MDHPFVRLKIFRKLPKHYNEFSKKVYSNKKNTDRLKIHNDLYIKIRNKIENQIKNKNYPIINKTLLKYLEEILNMNGEYDKLYNQFKKQELHKKNANNTISLTNRVFTNIRNTINRRVNTNFFNNQSKIVNNYEKLNGGLIFFNREYKIIFQAVFKKMSEFVELISKSTKATQEIVNAKEFIVRNQKFLTKIINFNKEYLELQQQINKNLGNNTNVRTVQG